MKNSTLMNTVYSELQRRYCKFSSGGHDVKDFDWQHYIEIADIYMTKGK